MEWKALLFLLHFAAGMTIGGGVALGADQKKQSEVDLAAVIATANESALTFMKERIGTTALTKSKFASDVIREGLAHDAKAAGNEIDPFKGAWLHFFYPEVTKNGRMWQIADHRYAKGDLGTMVEMDFAGSAFCLTLLLPKDSKLTNLTHAAWKAMVLSAKSRPVGIELPTFKIDDLTIGEAGLSVTEPAPTPIGTAFNPPKEVRVEFDKPFVFAVRHKRTGALVLAGTFAQP